MFIIVQLPFVDFRLLSTDLDKYEDCIFPNTFDRNMNKPVFYRFLGEQKNRYSPNQLPTSERQFFNAYKTLHINSEAFIGDGIYYPKLLFSRLFEEAQFFHFDIGIRETFKNGVHRHDLNRFIKDFLKSKIFCINSRYDNTKKNYNLTELAEQIKQIYLYATKCKKAEHYNNYLSQVILGHPALFIIYDKDEIHSFGNAKEIKVNTSIKIRYDLLSINNIFIDTWFIGKDNISKHNQDLRNLRIYLSKLHAYKETTRIIIDYLKRKKSDDLDMHTIITFFQSMLQLIEKERYYGYNNTDFWKIVFDIDNSYNNVSWDGYKQYMLAKIQEVSNMSQNNSTIIFNDSSGKGTTIINSPGSVTVNVNNENSMGESIKNFDAVLSELLKDFQLTNDQVALLNKQVETFKKYIADNSPDNSPQKGFAEKLLNNIKDAFNYIVGNAEGIQRLVLAGESIINMLK